MDRKGLAINALVMLIIVLAAAIFMMTFYVYVSLNATGSSAVGACSISAAFQEITSPGIGGINSPYDLYCPRRVLDVSTEGISASHIDFLKDRVSKVQYSFPVTPARGSDESLSLKISLDDDPELRASDAYALLSNELFECWQAFGSGQRDLLNQESLAQTANTCVICSQITFENAVSGNTQQLRAYMNRHLTPYQESTFGQEVYETVDPHYSGACRDMISADIFDFEQNQEYAVVYLRKSSRTQEIADTTIVPHWMVNWAGYIIDIGIDTPEEYVEENQPCMTVDIVPIQDIPRYCDVVVN